MFEIPIYRINKKIARGQRAPPAISILSEDATVVVTSSPKTNFG